MFTNPVFLNAYRFSSYELKKMEWLKELFVTNGYRFDPDRYPEVYYDDFNKVRHQLHDETDYLGVYIPYYQSNEEYNKIDSESKEGVIVLFKDRIEDYCKHTGLDEADVRFVVLMHELGHWLTHWAEHASVKTSNTRWIYGYHLYAQTRRTHEALAQLIAYWASDGNPNHEKTLFELSPKDSAGIKVDASAIYGGYIELVAKSKSAILKKLGDLRMFWIFTDERMMEFLLSTSVHILEWIDTHPDIPAPPTDITNSGWDTWINPKIKQELIDKEIVELFVWKEFIPLNVTNTKCVDFFLLLENRLYIPIKNYDDMVNKCNSDLYFYTYINLLAIDEKIKYVQMYNTKFPDEEFDMNKLQKYINIAILTLRYNL